MNISEPESPELLKLAGHNVPNITLGIYTHVNMEQQRLAMDAMQLVFG